MARGSSSVSIAVSEAINAANCRLPLIYAESISQLPCAYFWLGFLWFFSLCAAGSIQQVAGYQSPNGLRFGLSWPGPQVIASLRN